LDGIKNETGPPESIKVVPLRSTFAEEDIERMVSDKANQVENNKKRLSQQEMQITANQKTLVVQQDNLKAANDKLIALKMQLEALKTTSLDTKDQKYFFPNLDRIGAEALLNKTGGCCFLVRPSSKPNSYAISIYSPQYGFVHKLIVQVSNGFQIEGWDEVFPSIPSLLEESSHLTDFKPIEYTR